MACFPSCKHSYHSFSQEYTASEPDGEELRPDEAVRKIIKQNPKKKKDLASRQCRGTASTATVEVLADARGDVCVLPFWSFKTLVQDTGPVESVG